MDDARTVAFPIQPDCQIQQAAGAFRIAAGGAVQGFEKHLEGQRRFAGRSPVAQIVKQVGEVRQIGPQQGLLFGGQGELVAEAAREGEGRRAVIEQ